MLLAYPAVASRIVYRDVPLARALGRADVVVRAEALTPGDLDRFRVRSVLKGVGLRVGVEIEVTSPSAIAWARVRRSFQQTGVRRSPLVERLENTPHEPVAGEEYCLMLKPLPHPGHWVTSVENAWVSAPCEELMRLLGGTDDSGGSTRSGESP